MSEQSLSGASVAEYCRQRGLRSSQFFWWKRRLLDEAEESPFVAIEVVSEIESPQKSRSAIEVRLNSGRSVLVEPDFDAVHLRQLLAVLEA
ncbi:MAG: hypothetical protein FWD64_11940 [Acidobacteriaceae bacterium]|nr:hypothetical protein [Acidobacteriaceae bacterium]